MVRITIVNGVYEPFYNWGAPHCLDMLIFHSERRVFLPDGFVGVPESLKKLDGALRGGRGCATHCLAVFFLGISHNWGISQRSSWVSGCQMIRSSMPGNIQVQQMFGDNFAGWVLDVHHLFTGWW